MIQVSLYTDTFAASLHGKELCQWLFNLCIIIESNAECVFVGRRTMSLAYTLSLIVPIFRMVAVAMLERRTDPLAGHLGMLMNLCDNFRSRSNDYITFGLPLCLGPCAQTDAIWRDLIHLPFA